MTKLGKTLIFTGVTAITAGVTTVGYLQLGHGMEKGLKESENLFIEDKISKKRHYINSIIQTGGYLSSCALLGYGAGRIIKDITKKLK